MGRRSTGKFARAERDFYPTIDPRAVEPVIPHLHYETGGRYVEPCVGEGHLKRLLDRYGLVCVSSGDLLPGTEIPHLDEEWIRDCKADFIITNPPWDRAVLHPLIIRLSRLVPTWLLIDAPWMHTRQAAPYLQRCTAIVSVGRLKWFEDTPHQSKDDCAWFRFHWNHHAIGPRFFGRQATEE
jgi:hypothetical protein